MRSSIVQKHYSAYVCKTVQKHRTAYIWTTVQKHCTAYLCKTVHKRCTAYLCTTVHNHCTVYIHKTWQIHSTDKGEIFRLTEACSAAQVIFCGWILYQVPPYVCECICGYVPWKHYSVMTPTAAMCINHTLKVIPQRLCCLVHRDLLYQRNKLEILEGKGPMSSS